MIGTQIIENLETNKTNIYLSSQIIENLETNKTNIYLSSQIIENQKARHATMEIQIFWTGTKMWRG